MIPSWLVSLCAHISPTVLVLGSAALMGMLSLACASGAFLLLFGWPLKGWRERRRYHLTMAEWDARKQVGMPLTHTERLAYDLADPEWWDDLEATTWPRGEWVQEIRARRRGQS